MKIFMYNIRNSITISSELLESDVCTVPNVSVRYINNEYAWYTLPPIEINEDTIIFDLCFFNKRIQCLNISISNQEKYNSNWSDFSEVTEKLRARDTERLLNNLGYSIGAFQWGEIWCGYDAKSGLGYATVNYTL